MGFVKNPKMNSEWLTSSIWMKSCRLTYRCSPFVYRDSKNSGIPAALFTFRIKNRTQNPLIASLAFSWGNETPDHLAQAELRRSSEIVQLVYQYVNNEGYAIGVIPREVRYRYTGRKENPRRVKRTLWRQSWS
jgi:hypothetical protein